MSKEIPKHEHTHSLYVHCLSCKMFGTPMPNRYMDAVECGNCGSMDTVKYYPSCCIEADRAERESKAAQIRVPEKCNREYFPLSYGDGWDACLREIQRLNGIKEKVE